MRFFKPRSSFKDLSSIAIDQASVQVLHDAAAFKSQLLTQIEQAQKRIVLCSLYLQNDEAGQEILTALYEAKRSRPTLQIEVFVDWHRGQRGLIGEEKIPGKVAGNAAWYQLQSQANQEAIPIYGVPVQTRELFGVLHLKGFIFDDTVLYSGASINNVYLGQFEKYRHDRYWLIRNAQLADSMSRWIRESFLRSAAVQRLDQLQIPSTQSLRADIRQFREQLKKDNYHIEHGVPIDTQPNLAMTPIVGIGNHNRLNRYICQLIASAKTEIWICTPYFNFPAHITKEINRALKRGVRVHIVVGDKRANDFFIPPEQEFKAISCLPYLYEMNLRRFAKKHADDIAATRLQVHLWQDGENTYHLKGIWIDQEYTLITGNNLNPRAFRLDLENALLIRDPMGQLSVQRDAELRSILQHTTVLRAYQDLQKLADYPPRVRQFLARLSRVRLDRLAYRVL